MKKYEKIKVDKNVFHIKVNSVNSIIVQRHFTKHTGRDKEIHKLSIPKGPVWLYMVVSFIRFYQKYISGKLGNRCVFDPSCSRYAEQAFRKKGFFKGVVLTIKRLNRCRPENGGIDELN